MQPLFVFCADLHLEDGAWRSRPGIYGDAYYSFEQIVDYCIAHKLPLVMGGDILESKQNLARPIAKLCAGLTRMQEEALDVFYIQGNHEFDRNAPWLSIHPWTTHINGRSFRVGSMGDILVHGLDWLPKGEIQEALKTVPEDTDILITHQVWKDFMGEIGRTECELTDVHHVQTVLAGDFHVTKIAEGVNAQGQPIRMLSPGSTAMQDMSESPDKFFFVIGRDGDKIEFQPVQLKTRRFLSYTVKDAETLDQLCAGQLTKDISELPNDLPPGIDKPLVRIRFDKRLPDAFLRLTTAVSYFAHIACEAITEKSNTRNSGTRETAKNDLISAVADLLGDTTEAYKLAAALLNSVDPLKEFDEQFSRHTRELNDATLEIGSSELGTPSTADV